MAIKQKYQTFKTLAALRASLGVAGNIPEPDEVFYLAESGKEGYWYYDAADTTTADNTGLVVVTTTGSFRIKRRLTSPYVFKNWFTGSLAYFTNTADVNATIPLALRTRGMKVFVLDTIVREFWYRDGTSDGSLVAFAEVLNITNGPTTFDRKEILTVPNPNEIKGKSLSVTGSGNINVIPTVGIDSIDWVVDGTGLLAFSSGTRAARPTGFLGSRYYQTDILEGTYDHNGISWEYMVGANTLVNERFVSNGLVYYAGSNLVTGSNNQDADSFNRWRIDTGTNIAGGSRIRLSSSLSNFGTVGKLILHVEKVSVNSLSNGTDRYIFRVGRDVGVDVNGMWFEYTDNVASGQWNCVNYNGTKTQTASGVAVVANTEYELCIVYDFTGADNIQYYINNTLVATHTTNLPTDFINGFFGSMSIEKTLGTTNRAGFIGPIIIKRIQ